MKEIEEVKNSVEFKFSIPEKFEKASPVANKAIQLGAMAVRLTQENRQRCETPGGEAENVAEHTFMLSKIAPELAEEVYPELDANLVARYGALHDDVEAYVGDTPTDRITPDGMAHKEEREQLGVQQLCEEYSHIPSYTQKIKEYEAQAIPEARFVRVVDKLTVLLIQFHNQAKVLKQNYTAQELMDFNYKKTAELRAAYPEFEEIIEMREELAKLVVGEFYQETD